MNYLANDPFWQSKRIVVTGHTGFKGSWLCMWLNSMGAKVCGIALEPPTMPNLFNVARVADGLEHHIADIRDLAVLKDKISNFQPEIIFHLAAQPLVLRSYKDPIETYETNIMGTLNVLEAARYSRSVKAIVNITTDKCYENNDWVWGYRENDTMGGHDPYSNSKGCVELLSNAYRLSFLNPNGVALATARAGNVIGGGDWADDRLVPDILRALETGAEIEIRNPESIRPWQHVLEPLSGYLLLAQRLYNEGLVLAEGWNFGPREEDAKPVKWIVDYLCASWGTGASWIQQFGEHPHEANYLKLDTSKAKNRLNWTPRWGLDEALARVIEWQCEWLDGSDMKAVCLNQISEYVTEQ